MHDIMSEHRVLQTKCWFAKGKKKSFLYMKWKFHLKIAILSVFSGFLVWGTEYYLFLMRSTEEVIFIFWGLLMDIFIHSTYSMKHLFLFIEADIQYL